MSRPLLFLLIVLGATMARAAVIEFRSQSPGVSELEAMESARRQVARELLPLLRQRVESELARRGGGSVPPDTVLEPILRGRLTWPDAFNPRLRQEVRPYGTVYYADASIDLTGHWLADSTRLAVAEADFRRHATWGALTAMAGVGAILSLTYFTANTLTRGYYQGRLRLAALAAGASGIALVAAAYFALT
ncbi:MAG: hypothetical protein NZ561_03730 [Phycisphaerae bacterium]|nr:hypothetical protein [Phycisphaerae bacterium]MDW8261475.1 hypothetical protein [Phycisphaerales bacterium]